MHGCLFHSLLDQILQEFGVKCLVSFCSRVHKDRVISQKSRLEPPTTVDSITEAPKELSGEAEFDAAAEDLEMADECNDDDTVVVGRGSQSATAVAKSTLNESATSRQNDVIVLDNDDTSKTVAKTESANGGPLSFLSEVEARNGIQTDAFCTEVPDCSVPNGKHA